MIMEKATNNINDPKVRAYFDDVVEGKKPAFKLTADEYEQGINEFDEGMRKIIEDAAQKYFGKSRAWLMQKVNGNKIHGKTVTFTDDERRQFREALEDLSKKMSEVAMSL